MREYLGAVDDYQLMTTLRTEMSQLPRQGPRATANVDHRRAAARERRHLSLNVGDDRRLRPVAVCVRKPAALVRAERRILRHVPERLVRQPSKALVWSTCGHATSIDHGLP